VGPRTRFQTLAGQPVRNRNVERVALGRSDDDQLVPNLRGEARRLPSGGGRAHLYVHDLSVLDDHCVLEVDRDAEAAVYILDGIEGLRARHL
jgi:hypothetical protein